jgi:succinate dehydrogenase / fumarate reductase flavoprotein subunit
MALDSKSNGPIADKWTNYKDHINLVNPANKRNLDIIVVQGLAGGSAATLAELGYNVKLLLSGFTSSCTLLQRRGINAAKLGDGDSVFRLFYDTVKGGDYRSREANVHRLAEVSTNIIDRVLLKVCHLHVSMEGYLTTVL